MRKIKYLLMLVVAFLLAACDVETTIEAGGTSVEKMAGIWVVSVDAVDAKGNVVIAGFGGEGLHLRTYNTAANKSTEMWVDDGASFWDFKLKVDVDYKERAFTTNGERDNVAYDCKVNIDGGKVLGGAARTPSGMPADSIVFYVSFDDDSYPSKYDFAKYKVSGFRYTGFSGDN